ncbi:serine/threonine-protein kinase [Actinoplanes sp. NPDC049118]|uniref:serine/threonine-protein kinase n=1 Tax=Actinoplanes sp. NPDC049118 TaxID=3155769 RepID=UPI0033DC3371
MKIAERYRLIALIGSGGMGRVWRAHDDLLDRDVAVKEITSPGDQDRTVREARAAARLDHPNVVRIYDVVRTPGRSWIVMEYVAGRSLHEAVREDGPLSHREAARIGAAVLAALRNAHAAGVLHRDVKPHNVLIGTDGRVVLTDFGLAAIWDAGDGTAGENSTGVLVGSPNFMAPERIRTHASGAPGDLWSLGATLYAAVEGRAPFMRPTLAATLAAALTEDPDPPARPGPLHAAIGALLVRDPARRPSPDDASAMLESAAAAATPGRAVGVARVPPARPADEVVRYRPAAVRPPVAAAVEGGPGPWRGMRRVQIVIASVMVMLLGAAGVAVAAGGDDRPGATAPAAGVVTGPPAAGGWVGHRDPAGFRLELPAGWRRSAAGNAVEFRDPAGVRALTVDTGEPATSDPLGYWRAAERTALAAGSLPGYARISMGNLTFRGGGADWEYTLAAARGAPAAHPAGPAVLSRRLDHPRAGLGGRGGDPAAHPGRTHGAVGEPSRGAVLTTRGRSAAPAGRAAAAPTCRSSPPPRSPRRGRWRWPRR